MHSFLAFLEILMLIYLYVQFNFVFDKENTSIDNLLRKYRKIQNTVAANGTLKKVFLT